MLTALVSKVSAVDSDVANWSALECGRSEVTLANAPGAWILQSDCLT